MIDLHRTPCLSLFFYVFLPSRPSLQNSYLVCWSSVFPVTFMTSTRCGLLADALSNPFNLVSVAIVVRQTIWLDNSLLVLFGHLKFTQGSP